MYNQHMKSDPKLTAELVRKVIHKHGINKVREILFTSPAHEVVALTNFINSRMQADVIIGQLTDSYEG
jgi:hypothetical protein